jgi:hemolysin III
LQALERPANFTRTLEEEFAEERLNSLTHGVGLVAAVAAFAVLLAQAIVGGGSLRLAGCGIYGVSLMLMYAASTALHTFRSPELRLRCQVADHVSIYLLIAGTYTPFLLTLLHTQIAWALLVIVWTIAAAGIANKVYHGDHLDDTSAMPYVGLGWLALFIVKPLFAAMPAPGVFLLIAGGIAYSLGVPFFCRDDKRGFHAIWHLFVLAGSACHFFAILIYVAK